VTEPYDLRQLQVAFAAHLRDPAHNPPVSGVEDRRMAIYRQLFFSSIEGLLAGNFPVLKRLLAGGDAWQPLVRRFYADHGAATPYFPRIAGEFVTWLEEQQGALALPDWAAELAHYEWLEVELGIDETELPLAAVDAEGDLLAGRPALSPLASAVAYAWPVHRLAPGAVPAEPPSLATRLVVCRDREDRIGFMELNAVTWRLLEHLEGRSGPSGRAVLERIAAELGRSDIQTIVGAGAEILRRLRERDIVLGTWQETD
jgi:uncharacterized protein